MELLIQRIKDNLNEELIRITVSNPRKAEEIKKYSLRPVLVKETLVFQMESYTKTQVFHENLDKDGVVRKMKEILPGYKQVQIQGASGDLTALINKKGKAAVRIAGRNQGGQKLPDKERLRHNRQKKYILQEGIPVPFLQDLGVMTAEGKIIQSKYDKFRQINRFLEFIEDVLPHLREDRQITILDFGCGKSYLTFAVYYYLKELRGRNIRIIGLDLKKDVIKTCSRLARQYGYDALHFYEGSIEEFEGVEKVDMVITLHACDTATDYALYKAVRWKADVILSVPCCQHELNRQLSADKLRPVSRYGILKERFAAMATDALRADLLEAVGYETQILEFIDMEHTPKNLLIRGIKRGGGSEKKWREAEDFCEAFGLRPSLKALLETERGQKI
ncbi:MAG: SAM-dependent methyltransferase [Eubacteriales bacterium]|nr:SAM-dependent methyltransferase [Eubacteriales bacterium]